MKAWNSDESPTPPAGEETGIYGLRWTRGDGGKVMIYDLPKADLDQEKVLLEEENPEVVQWNGTEWVATEVQV